MDGTDNQEMNGPPVEGVAGGGTAYGWNNSGLHASEVKGSIDLFKVPTSDLVHVWCMPSTANVGQQEMPRQMEPINLLAARNERESFQVAVRPKVSWMSCGIAGIIQVHCTDLQSMSGDRLMLGKDVTLRRVAQVLGFPDALVPLDIPYAQISLTLGETNSIWISTDVPDTQRPGIYEGELIVTAMKPDSELLSHHLSKAERHQMYMELRSCYDILENAGLQVESVQSAISSLRRILLSSSFTEFHSDDSPADMIMEDIAPNLPVHLKISLTVWDFALPKTPSLPAVVGISDTVIEDRFSVEHGTKEWYETLDWHFKWLLQYRVSPFFCKWGSSMRVLTYTCPWPADHPKSDEYFCDQRLAAYAVPYHPVVLSSDAAHDYLQREIEILRGKPHWNKAYFYLWDEPVNLEQYDSLRSMASEIHSYASDARVLTTYYSGPNDAPLASTSFEAFVKVPKFLRPHSQIYCTSEWVLGNREDLVKDIISELQPENREEWWTYVCMGPSDPHPNWHLGMRGTQHRAVFWRVWKEGGTGFLYWGANCYEKAMAPNAEVKFRRGLPPGDGVLFYPGEVFSASHQPVASVRLERILSGLQDLEYLQLYSSRFGRDEALSLLERTGVYLGPERYTLEHLPIDIMRAEIYNKCRS